MHYNAVDVEDRRQRLSMLEWELGLQCLQQNKQRIFCPKTGPYNFWEQGSEVFVGKIPVVELEDKVVDLFKDRWQVKQTRLLMSSESVNRGYCFVLLASPQEAKEAVAALQDTELCNGWRIAPLDIKVSIDNRKLFVGQIPTHLDQNEIRQQVCSILQYNQDEVSVCLYKNWEDPSQNRGFCFLEFKSHRMAMYAKIHLKKKLPEQWRIENCLVNWAIPENDVDPTIMAKVKKIFIRGLRLETTKDQVEQMIHKMLKLGKANILNVSKTRDYAFVTFSTRDMALYAISKMNGYNLDGAVLDVQLARPPSEKYWTEKPRHPRLAALNNIQQSLPAASASPYKVVPPPVGPATSVPTCTIVPFWNM